MSGISDAIINQSTESIYFWDILDEKILVGGGT